MATRVFIVDDHPLVREWLSALLRKQPDLELCGAAQDTADALPAMLVDPPDVAIVDLSLKGGSGIDLIKDLAENLPGTQAIVLSMHEEIFYVERAMRAGARGYVTKQEATDRILEAIRTVQSGQVFMSPGMMEAMTFRMAGLPVGTIASHIESLSERERDVFRRLGQGQTTRQISLDLQISIKTVQAYAARIKEKLKLANGTELLREAVRWVEQQPGA
jgi:DNA-binding NarL/FixJ family response regulator